MRLGIGGFVPKHSHVSSAGMFLLLRLALQARQQGRSFALVGLTGVSLEDWQLLSVRAGLQV